MIRLLKKFFHPHLLPLNTIEISQKTILDNLSYLQSLKPNDALFPVLKSNAFGHGLKEVSTVLRTTKVPYICVDSFPEYQIVKDYAKKKVLVMGETLPENYRYYHPRHATLVVYTLATLKLLSQQTTPHTIHLFLNTGMNREWIQIDQLKESLEVLLRARHLTLEWVMSHLANADEINSSFNDTQIATFKSMYALIEQAWFRPKRKHIGNSAWFAKIDDNFFNTRRVWIALYGYNNLQITDPFSTVFAPLHPALRVLTTVVSKQLLSPGDIVSYGGRFVAPETMQTVTIPFGYHEWLDRRLTGKRYVKRWQVALPLVGTICMNLSCIDTEGNDLQIGDSIELIGRDKDTINSLHALATICETIPYEILVKLDSKIRRTIV